MTPLQGNSAQTSAPGSLGDDDREIDTPSSPDPLSGVNDFLYQLQDIDLKAVGKTAYDLVIMDYSSSGGEDGRFSQEQIRALKHSPGGPKIVLAYMSIGEAEDYRFYWSREWDGNEPSWLEMENPDWPGNYKVRYWDQDWRTIVFQYADRVLARDSPDQTNFPRNSSFWDTVKYNPAFQGRQMRPDSLKFPVFI